MRIVKNIAFFIVTILITLSWGCKKDTDTEFPSVRYDIPTDNQYFTVGDTIPVKAVISDNKKIESVSIVLCNEDYIPVLKNYSVPVAGNPMTLNFIYPLDDVYMPSGDYYLRITVSDGVNLENRYRRLKITGAQKHFEGFVVASSFSGHYKLEYSDTIYALNNFVPWTDDFSDLAFMPYEKKIIVTGSKRALVQGFTFDDKIKFFEKDEPNATNNPYYTGVFTENRYFNLMKYDGHIERYNSAGMKVQTVETRPGYFPAEAIKSGDDLIVYEENKTANKQNIVSVYYTPTSALKFYYTIDFKITKMICLNPETVLLVGYSNSNPNEGVMKYYNIVKNEMTTVQMTYHFSQLTDAVRTIGGFFVIEDSKLKKIDLCGKTVTDENINATALYYDETENILFVVYGGKITMYSNPDLNYIDFMMVQGTVSDMDFVYRME